MRALLPCLLLLIASACAHAPETLRQAGAETYEFSKTAGGKAAQMGAAAHAELTGPQLAAVAREDVYSKARPAAYPDAGQDRAAEAAGPNSLWRAGSKTFFNDPRAGRVGDILTVRIEIADSAAVSNSSQRSRSGSTEVGVTGLFGKQEALGRLLPPGGEFDPSNLIGAEGNSTASGNGAITRTERIELTVAAVVTQILPNGNFVIAGRQEVRINAELRELTVAGIIRPEDISAVNTIRHTQIAEARISYGGRGQISAVQRPRLGQRIADAVSPW